MTRSRIEFRHFAVELSRGRRRPGQAVEIADVLPGLFTNLGAIVLPGPLMSGDHSARLSLWLTGMKRESLFQKLSTTVFCPELAF